MDTGLIYELCGKMHNFDDYRQSKRINDGTVADSPHCIAALGTRVSVAVSGDLH